jgi:hypothetical protein
LFELSATVLFQPLCLPLGLPLGPSSSVQHKERCVEKLDASFKHTRPQDAKLLICFCKFRVLDTATFEAFSTPHMPHSEPTRLLVMHLMRLSSIRDMIYPSSIGERRPKVSSATRPSCCSQSKAPPHRCAALTRNMQQMARNEA